uniref:Protease Do-like 14 n=1 Tax=Aegilops tauschii TaxID=37682 RepID=M8C3E1_AEGTA
METQVSSWQENETALDPRGAAVPLTAIEPQGGRGDGKLDCVPQTGSMVIGQAEWEIMGILSTNLDLQRSFLAQIEVCLPGGFRVVGILNCYNLHYNVALVDIMGFWRPRTIKIHGHPVTSSMDVIAVGSLFARRKLMAVEGKVLIGKQSKLDCKELCVSTCEITKAGIGGPLIDNDGNFVGMNFYDEEETPFLPRDVIHRLLLNFNKTRTSADGTIAESVENRWPLPEPRFLRCRDIRLPLQKWPLRRRRPLPV